MDERPVIRADVGLFLLLGHTEAEMWEIGFKLPLLLLEMSYFLLVSAGATLCGGRLCLCAIGGDYTEEEGVCVRASVFVACIYTTPLFL